MLQRYVFVCRGRVVWQVGRKPKQFQNKMLFSQTVEQGGLLWPVVDLG